MNPHRTDLRHTARQRCKGTALLTVLFTLILALCTGFAVRPAHAEEPDATTNTDQAAKPGVSITVNSMTPVITPSSGYKLNLTVTNNTDADVDHGSIDALTNFTYNFISRTDLQEWAEGRGQIPLPDLLVTLHVPRIAAHKSVTVNSSLPASEEILKQFNSWGPRPLALDYRSDDGAQTSTLHSFVTRSQDGLQGERTPQLHMTMLMPLTAGDWSLDETTLKALRADRSAKTHASAIATLDGKSAEALRTKDQLTQRFPHVQALADPQVLATLQAPHMQALMQPADFDITRYSYADNANGYENAGVPLSSWAASSSVRTLRTVLNDGAAERPVYAMQGVGAWNTEALDTARMQGYDTVIATHDFDDQDDTAAHTGVYRVPTAHGDVTVMATHPMLSQLAAGQATSQEAQAETNTAGRLQRFIAQSAFYQMEQPYQNRCLLVSFGPDSSAANIAAFMGALQEASWLDLTDLETLRASEPYMSGDDAATVADTTTVDPAAYDTTTLDTTLTTLAHTRRDLQHFNTSVLLADGSMPGGPAAQTGDANNTKPGDGDANDADDASDNATSDTSGDALGALQWSNRWLQAHDELALLSLNANTARSSALTAATQAMVDYLRQGIGLTTPTNVNVVSESASLPVTVTNSLPYPISLRISSRTDSMEIVTSRFVDVNVPPGSEAQATLEIRVSTAGTTVANQELVNHEGVPLSGIHTTTITSSLQISDKSGIVFIIIAVLLGIVGLWRQFHRKKDPDE